MECHENISFFSILPQKTYKSGSKMSQIKYDAIMDLSPKIQSKLSFSASTCNETLVDTVTDDKLTASSEYDVIYTAGKARLSSTGWGSKSNTEDNAPWIQVTICFLFLSPV